MPRTNDLSTRVLAAGALLACLALPALAAQTCGQFPTPGFDAPDMRRVDGRYVNVQYRYAVTIARGLSAYTSPPPQPDHGVGIVLSWEPRSYLFVDGTYDDLEWKKASAAARQLLAWTREESTEVLSHAQSRARLGVLRAVRLVVRHRCANLPEVYVDDGVVAIDAKRGVVYKLSLTTTESRYARDRARMDQMLSTWREVD